MEEEKAGCRFTSSMSACTALLWFSKLTGFQDSEPGVGFGGFGAVTWAGRHVRTVSPSFLSSSPANNRAREGLAVKGEAQGWCGPQP